MTKLPADLAQERDLIRQAAHAFHHVTNVGGSGFHVGGQQAIGRAATQNHFSPWIRYQPGRSGSSEAWPSRSARAAAGAFHWAMPRLRLGTAYHSLDNGYRIRRDRPRPTATPIIVISRPNRDGYDVVRRGIDGT